MVAMVRFPAIDGARAHDGGHGVRAYVRTKEILRIAPRHPTRACIRCCWQNSFGVKTRDSFVVIGWKRSGAAAQFGVQRTGLEARTTGSMRVGLPALATVVLLLAIVLVLCIGLVRRTAAGPAPTDELERLRHANALLQLRLQAYEKAHAMRRSCPPSMPPPLLESTSSTTYDSGEMQRPQHESTPSTTDAAGSGSAPSPLLEIHRHWDWRSIVSEFLRPWPAVTRQHLDAAVAACNGSSMYCQRFQVHRGRLYITDCTCGTARLADVPLPRCTPTAVRPRPVLLTAGGSLAACLGSHARLHADRAGP